MNDTSVRVVTDHAFRSAIDALLTAQKLRERDISFDMLTFPVDVQSEMGAVFYGVLALFAEFERRMIRRRTTEGLEAARRRGVQLGRPRCLSEAQVRKAYSKLLNGNSSCREIATAYGVSRLTLQRAFRRQRLDYSSLKQTKGAQP